MRSEKPRHTRKRAGAGMDVGTRYTCYAGHLHQGGSNGAGEGHGDVGAGTAGAGESDLDNTFSGDICHNSISAMSENEGPDAVQCPVHGAPLNWRAAAASRIIRALRQGTGHAANPSSRFLAATSMPSPAAKLRPKTFSLICRVNSG